MRYSRQVIFEHIGKDKQDLLHNSKAAIVGCGGLGTRTAELLARAGVGKLILIDKDNVELSNLQRQTLFYESDIGKPKVQAAKEKLELINSTIKVEAKTEALNKTNIDLLKSDLVLDCTDNLDTRFLINEYCVANKIPWIYAGVVGSTGMIMSIMPRRDYCFNCIFKETCCNENCETRGILNSAATAVSAIQTTEALKILTKQTPENALITIDIWSLKLSKINVKRNPNCPVCANKN